MSRQATTPAVSAGAKKGPAFMDFSSSSFDFGLPDVRNGYLPPRYRVFELPTASKRCVVPPVPLLTDLQGEDPCPLDVRLRIAHRAGKLLVRADVTDSPATLREVAPSDPHFWMQDHIEFRLLLGERRQAQWIVSPDGRAFSNLGAVAESATRARGEVNEDGWWVELDIDGSELDRGAFRESEVLKGQVAYTRWRAESVQFWGFASTELGYNQEERFGEFVLAGEVGGVPALDDFRAEKGRLISGKNPFVLSVSGAKGLPLTFRTERDGETAQCPLAPHADGTVRADVGLGRPRFTRIAVFAGENELGAVSVRAGVPSVECAIEPHPRLTEGVVAQEEVALPEAEVDLAALRRERFPDPAAPEAFFFHFDPADGKDAEAGWFRVCRESLVGRGAKGGHSVQSHIWGLLGEAAQQAAREVSANVGIAAKQVGPLKEAFNRIVQMEDFYREDIFADAQLPGMGRRLIEKKAARGLNAAETAKLNRLLLQSSIECLRCFGVHILRDAVQLVPVWAKHPSRELLAEITRRVGVFRGVYLPEEHSHLHEGGMARKLGEAYDQVYEHLDATAREVWLDVVNIYLEQFLHSSRTHAWTVVCVPNANAVTNGGLGTLALAALGDSPLAEEALWWARKHIRLYFDYCSGADGGNTEGTMYQRYGMGSSRPFLCAMEKVLGTDEGLFDHPAWRNYMNMVRISLTNDGGMHGVNDTTPAPYSGDLAWFLGRRTGDEFAIWYGDHCLRMAEANERREKRLPIDRLAAEQRPDLPAVAEQPPLPTCMVLRDIQYSIMRSGPKYDCNLVAGLKGARPPFTHHNQFDAGSIWIHVKGERLLIDPGYHKGQATDHCLPLIGGRGPIREGFVSQIIACEEGKGWRHLAADSTPAYEGAAERVRRHLIMLGRHTLVIVDDIVAAEEVCVQSQCGGPTKRVGDHAFRVVGKKTALRITFLDEQGEPELRDERPLTDTHFGYNFADCRLFPVHYRYRPAPGTPAVCMIQQVGASPAAVAEREGCAWVFSMSEFPLLRLKPDRSGTVCEFGECPE